MLAFLTLVGFLAYRHVDYASDLWWEFAWDGDAPRFLRATLALVVLAAAIALDPFNSSATPEAHRQRSDSGRGEADRRGEC